MKKEYIIGLVLLLAGVGFFVMQGNDGEEGGVQQTTSVESDQDDEENTVIYMDSGFSPSEVTVDTGTTVRFVNQSDKPMWVASDPHPAHTDYSAFDQLGDGNEYSFTFAEAGSYPFHNHLVPTDTGVVVVE